MKYLYRIAVFFCFAWLTLSLRWPVLLTAQGKEHRPTKAGAATTITAQNVELVGHIGGATDCVFVVNNRAYIGEGPRLTILDVTNPAKPIVLGKTIPFAGLLKDVLVVGNLAYVIEENGLHIVDVTNAAAPTLSGFYDTPGRAAAVSVVGNYAYVADGESGLRVVNVSDPANPTEVGFYDTPGIAIGIYVVGNYAYVGDSSSGLRIVDISNPVSPAEVGFVNTVGITSGVYVVGNLAYVADNPKGLRIINVANPQTPTEVGFFNTPGIALRVQVIGNLAYIADSYGGGLQIVNVANPAAPTSVGSYDTPGYAPGVFVSGTVAYVADDEEGLRLYNVANPASPTEIAAYETGGGARNVYVVGNTAYLASGALRMINVSDPTNPTEIGSYRGPGYIRDVNVIGNVAYLADGQGLRTINVANPANPVALGFYGSPGGAWGLYVTGNIGYLADYDSLRLVNISNPANPTELGIYPSTGGTIRGVRTTSNYAYVGDGINGLRILNITTPSTPQLVGTLDTPDDARDIDVRNDIVYVADDRGGGLRIIDASLPSTPVALGAYDTPGDAYSVQVVGTTAYVADGDKGLRVVDVTDPKKPTEVGFFDTPGFVYGVFVTGNTIYAADWQGGLFILRYPPCYTLTLTHTGAGGDPTASPTNSSGCPSGKFVNNATVNLTANPAAGWHVAGWNGTNNDNSTAKTNTLTMAAVERQATVKYAATCYTLTLTHNGSGNDPSATPANSAGCAAGQYTVGEVIALHATPNTGYAASSWSGTTSDSSTANDNTLSMPPNNSTVSVTYTLACYNLSLTHTGSGSDPVATPTQSVGCSTGRYHYNEAINLAATAATGWQIASWSGAANNASTVPTNTLTMPPNDLTVSVNYGELPSAGPGDAYEQDNSCTRSRLIVADGSDEQEHTFHAVADVDWVRFNATAGATYRIEVQVPVTSTADVNLELYDQCDGTLKGEWKESFSPGARLDFKATANGPLYLRLADQDANVAGDKVRYEISVRALATANNNRALIILAGRLRGADTLQTNINNVAKDVYTVFQRNGYTSDNIYFLATDANLPGYTAAATRDSLHAAISTWAKGKLQKDGVLTLYLVDHGSPDLFYIDELSGQRLTPTDLDGWLSELESAVPGIKINVIIEACESGSFISLPNSISKPGRVIITSSDAVNDAKASKDGAYFSDHLLTWLRQGYNLAVGFGEARTVAKSIFALQQAQIDADGNSMTNEASDITLAAGRSFAYAGTLGDDWPPYIFAAQGPSALTNFSGVLQADVRDNQSVREVWAVVYPPDYTPPPTGDVLQAETQPTILLSRVENGDLWRGTYTGFTQPGIYRIVIQADDNEGLKARPFVIEVNAGSRVFLPLVRR